jgi:hypothetical protein
MDVSDLLLDGFGRVAQEVRAVVGGLSRDQLAWRVDPAANTVGWLVWHLTRVQDDHVAAAFGQDQVWTTDGWRERFGLPFPPSATGYGHDAAAVGAVTPDGDVLLAYHHGVHTRTLDLVREVTPGELDRIVDERWGGVTLGVRLVSVLSDDLQHVGQAAFVRGVLDRTGR